MSNIHRISDLSSTGRNESIRNSPFLYQGNEQIKHPNEENFIDFLRFSFCPTLSLKYFIFWISVAQVIYFTIEVCIATHLQSQFLEPDVRTLVDLGAKYPFKIYNGEVFRWITPVMLHGHFMHLLTNFVSQVIFGSSLERVIGTPKFVILYLGSAVGGNMFSAMISDDIAVGASTGIFGIMAGQLCYFVINWNSLRALGQMRIQYLIFLIFIIFMNIIIGFSFKGEVDNFGHLGGFISGVLISYILIDCLSEDEEPRKIRLAAKFSLLGFYALCIIVFFTSGEPIQKI